MVHSKPPDPALSASHLSDVEGRARRVRARATFWVLTLLGATTGAAIGATIAHPLIGFAAGALAGAVAGTAVTVVMTVWPLLRALWHWLIELTAVVGVVAAVTGW